MPTTTTTKLGGDNVVAERKESFRLPVIEGLAVDGGVAAVPVFVGRDDDRIIVTGNNEIDAMTAHFLVAPARGAQGLVLIALDDDKTPTSYLAIRGVNVATRRKTVVVDGFDEIGSIGACQTFTTPNATKVPRIVCTSSAGGLFELELPIDLSECADHWTSLDDMTATACDLRSVVCPSCVRPFLRFVADSEAAPDDDGVPPVGFGCRYAPPSVKISKILSSFSILTTTTGPEHPSGSSPALRVALSDALG